MLKKLLGKMFSSNSNKVRKVDGVFIIAHLNDKIMPMYRGTNYEDPLDEFLQENNYGEVTGGGTGQAVTGEIEFCDIEIIVYEGNDIEKVVSLITSKLESLGAPKGSHITVGSSQEKISFGMNEGIAVYLDGVNLPENVYKECDINVVVSELSNLIGYNGEVQRYWQGNIETALYFYGLSFEKMKGDIEEFIRTYPLCQGARITQIA